jgi:glycosyltransferase involved in cell wall biosynthesis
MEKQRVLLMNLTPRWWMLHYSSQFCNALNEIDYIEIKVAIASYHKSNLYNKHIKFLKIRTNPNFKSFILDTLNFFYHLFFIFQIIKFKPNIVHFLDNHPWYVFYWKLFKIFWYTIYTTQHDPILHSWENTTLLWKIAEKVNWILRNISDKLFVHWGKLKWEVIKKYNVSDDKVYSIVHWNYNFFKDNFSKWWIVEKNTFLFFGRIVDYKWLDLLLDSLRIVKKTIPDFRLIIAWPWSLDKYWSKIEWLKDNIDIYNYNIEPEEAYKYFEKSEFVVLPYLDATWSGVIPVAYAFSKAVLVTDVWELASVVWNSETGFIIEWKGVEQLSQKIIVMLKDKSKVMKMWKEWRKFTEQKLSWNTIVTNIY